MFEPIDNQRYAQLVGCNYNDPLHRNGKLAYGITHLAAPRLHELEDMGPGAALITSFSDASVTNAMARDLPEGITWYSNNVETFHPRVHAIPIGFAFNVVRTVELLRQAKEGRLPRKNLMYVNFFRAIPRPINPRMGLYEVFGGMPWVTCKGGSGLSSVPPEEFYQDIRAHDYVLSPPGAGPDCHRHWEAMALGSIPIVLYSRATDLLEDMPALRVNNWSEVTRRKLLHERERLRERFQWSSMQKLDMAYWRKVILG